MSHATCRGTQTRGVCEVVDDKRRDEPRDEPHDVPKQPEARRRKIDSALTRARRLASMDLVDEGPSNLPGGDDHPYPARQLSVF
jgi:hypothetical protein